jgi:hypothetical protein
LGFYQPAKHHDLGLKCLQLLKNHPGGGHGGLRGRFEDELRCLIGHAIGYRRARRFRGGTAKARRGVFHRSHGAVAQGSR